VARNNVELTMAEIHRRGSVLPDLETSRAIKVAGAMRNLETGVIEFFDYCDQEGVRGRLNLFVE
jgi:carbonic anhydrase